MKRILSLTLALIMLFSFVGCNKKSDDKSDGNSNKKTQQNQLSKTITTSNGDEIELTFTKSDNVIKVIVSGEKVFESNYFKKYESEYDFDKDFNFDIKDEYSDEEILWAYRFDWGSIYSTKHDYLHTEDTNDDTTLIYVCPKHEYKKSYFKNANYYKIAEEWDLIDFDTIEETGEKIFWDSYTAAQVIFESFYNTEDYALKEINNLEKAGYSLDDYYEMHNREFSSGAGLNKWQKIYEVSVKGEPFALIYSDASTAQYLLQELGWKEAYPVLCKPVQYGVEYSVDFPSNCDDEWTDIS